MADATQRDPHATKGTAIAHGDDDFGCFKGLLQFAGYAFGVLTVIINIADVTTDIIVAIQFHRDGETTWFWLVVSSLILAHLVYTFIGTAVLHDQPAYTAWRRVADASPLRFSRSSRTVASSSAFARVTPSSCCA